MAGMKGLSARTLSGAKLRAADTAERRQRHRARIARIDVAIKDLVARMKAGDKKVTEERIAELQREKAERISALEGAGARVN